MVALNQAHKMLIHKNSSPEVVARSGENRVRGIAAASLKETVMIKPSRRFPGEISVARKLCPSSKFWEIRAILQ